MFLNFKQAEYYSFTKDMLENTELDIELADNDRSKCIKKQKLIHRRFYGTGGRATVDMDFLYINYI